MIGPLVRDTVRYVRENDLRTIIRDFNSRDAHPIVQFGKYGICGVAAVIVQVAGFYLFSNWFPSSIASGLSNHDRAVNATIANLLAFPFGNAVAYATNALWVFHGGRHHRVKEFFYFTAISLFSFLAGLLGGPFLIKHYGISQHLAEGGFVVTSALVNFICRKFFVFRG